MKRDQIISTIILVPFALILAVLLGIIILTILLIAVLLPSNSITNVFPSNISVSIENIQKFSNDIATFGTRVPNTIGNNKTRDYIVDILRKNDFFVEIDSFIDSTPYGPVQFSNIIGTWNKYNNTKRVIISAHYDSKLFNFYFIGATDSIVPCGMMLDLVEFVKIISKFKFNIQFVFFDGEEAFVQWTRTDSTYGSRHLAAKWESENNLKNIELFILLDLIGGSNPRFYNLNVHFITGTNNKFTDIFNIQNTLTSSNYFINQRVYDQIEDDHVPFQQRGVPIIHLITVPFPNVWHSASDTMNNIDWNSVKTIQLILKNYLFNKFT